MKRFLFAFIFLLGAGASAQEVLKNQIQNLAHTIYYDVEQTQASRKELRQARDHLQSALHLVRAESGFPPPNYIWRVIQRGPGGGYEAPASCYASGHTTGCQTIANQACTELGQRVVACDGYNRVDCVVECSRK